MFGVLIGAQLDARAASPSVAILIGASSSIPLGGAKQVLEAASRGVGYAQGIAVTPPPSHDTASNCETADCLAQVGRAAGATFVLRIDATYADQGFRLQLTMADGKTGRSLGTDSMDCPICDPPDLYESVRRRTAALCSSVFQMPTAAPSLTAAPSSTPVVTVPSAPVTRAAPSRILPYSLLGGGLVLGAVGGYLLAVNGNSVNCETPPGGGPQVCPDMRATKSAGIALIAAGGLAVAGGVALWIYDASQSRVAIGASPGGVVIAGRF
jgi:hypothetical protein